MTSRLTPAAKRLSLYFFLSDFTLKSMTDLLGRHDDGRSDEARQLLGGEEYLLHLQFGLGQIGVVVGGVRLDGADEFRRTACLLDERRGVQRVLLGLVVVLFPIQVVQKAHDAPELLIFRVVLAGEVAHGLLDGLAMLDMEGVLVVSGEQLGGLFAGHAGRKVRSWASPLVSFFAS